MRTLFSEWTPPSRTRHRSAASVPTGMASGSARVSRKRWRGRRDPRLLHAAREWREPAHGQSSSRPARSARSFAAKFGAFGRGLLLETDPAPSESGRGNPGTHPALILAPPAPPPHGPLSFRDWQMLKGNHWGSRPDQAYRGVVWTENDHGSDPRAPPTEPPPLPMCCAGPPAGPIRATASGC
jgi:hypothetical protein